MFTLGDDGITVTLREAGGIGTRRYGGVTVRATGCGGTMLGRAGLAMALSNNLERSTMDCCWASTKWANGGGMCWVG